MMPLIGAVSRETEPVDTPSRAPREALAGAESYLEHRVSTQDNKQLYVREYGPGRTGATPLLCLPGYTRNCRDFHDLAIRQGNFRRVICPDLRGRGKSAYDRKARHYAAETAMADLLALLTALRLDRCVVLGTSFGGVLGMALAVLRPRALAGLILNDAGPEFDADGLRFIADYIGAPEAQPDWEAAAAHGRELVGKGWNKDDAAWLRVARQGYSRRADGMLRFDYDPAIVQPLRAILGAGRRAHDMWALFRALGATPTLLLRGELSPVLKEKSVLAMIRAKPDLKQVTIPGVGHAPFLDEAEAIEAIDGFLARFA